MCEAGPGRGTIINCFYIAFRLDLIKISLKIRLFELRIYGCVETLQLAAFDSLSR